MAALLDDRPNVDTGTRLDSHDLEVYACDSNEMVYSLETAARQLGVPQRHVHREGYENAERAVETPAAIRVYIAVSGVRTGTY